MSERPNERDVIADFLAQRYDDDQAHRGADVLLGRLDSAGLTFAPSDGEWSRVATEYERMLDELSIVKMDRDSLRRQIEDMEPKAQEFAAENARLRAVVEALVEYIPYEGTWAGIKQLAAMETAWLKVKDAYRALDVSGEAT